MKRDVVGVRAGLGGWVAVYRCVKLGKNESTAGCSTAIIPETRYQDVCTYTVATYVTRTDQRDDDAESAANAFPALV